MAKTKLQYSIGMSVSHVYNNMSVLDITCTVTKSRIAKPYLYLNRILVNSI
jgi:hypothetical protein